MRFVSVLCFALPGLLYSAPLGRVVSVIGVADNGEIRLRAGDIISEKQNIQTANRSSLKILLKDRTIVELGASGWFTIEKRSKETVDLSLKAGTVRVSLSKHNDNKPYFFIRTEDTTMALKGTQVVVKRRMGQDSFMLITGRAEMILPHLKFARTLNAGQQFKIAPTASHDEPLGTWREPASGPPSTEVKQNSPPQAQNTNPPVSVVCHASDCTYKPVNRDIASESKPETRGSRHPEVSSFDPDKALVDVQMPSTILYEESSGDGKNGGRQTGVFAAEASLRLKSPSVPDSDIAAKVAKNVGYDKDHLKNLPPPVPDTAMRIRFKQ